MDIAPTRTPLASTRDDGATGQRRVLDAALRAVRRDGPRVTMHAIAAEAGVTKPIVYREIGDKRAVAEAVAEELSLMVGRVVSTAIAAERTLEDRIRAGTRAYFEFLWSERELFLFVDYGWGSDDGNQLEMMIERATRLFVPSTVESLTDDAGDGARTRTWAYGTVGALRTMAVMWVRSPYCPVEQLVDDATAFIARVQT